MTAHDAAMAALPDDLGFLRGRVEYWDKHLTELYDQCGIKPLLSCVVSMLANRDAFERYRARAALASPQQADDVVRDAERWRMQRTLGVPGQDGGGFWTVWVGQAADVAIDKLIEKAYAAIKEPTRG